MLRPKPTLISRHVLTLYLLYCDMNRLDAGPHYELGRSKCVYSW